MRLPARRLLRYILAPTSALLLVGCAIVYRLPIRQGNVIQQSQLEKLQLGMTQQQVQYVMGTPIASNPFQNNRWDYLSYYKSPHGAVSSRNVSLLFTDGKLSKMVGVNDIAAADKTRAADAQALALERQAIQFETERDQRTPGRSGASVPVPTATGPR